jgi:osmoprotectant transport system substrate-binding protein
VFRKHNRRAAKAAYAVSLGVALLIGLLVAGGAGASPAAKPTIVVGTKNFTEAYVLGELYKQALQAKGYTVKYKANIGSSELIDTAFQSGKINFYPEYVGVLVTAIAKQTAPKTLSATVAAARTFEASKRNGVVYNLTPFSDTDSFGMLTSTAQKYGAKTISDMKKVKSFSFAGFPECATRTTCLLGLKNVYGLKQTKFVPLGSISVYTLLDKGTVTAGDVFSTDPQLQDKSKYTVLKDTKHIFGFQNVAPIVSKKVDSAALRTVVNAVSKKLTLPAIQAMNKAVAIDKQSPAKVADAFLKANNLK